MKERNAQYSALANDPRRDALTPEQIAVPACETGWFRRGHSWDRVPDESADYQYFQCRDCFDRKAVKVARGNVVGATFWLRGKAMDYQPLPPAGSGLASDVSNTARLRVGLIDLGPRQPVDLEKLREYSETRVGHWLHKG